MENKLTIERFLRWAGIAFLAAAAVVAVNFLGNVLLPFFIAWFFAYLLYPVVKFVQYRLRVRVRALAIILTMLLTAGLLTGVFCLIVPPMLEQIDKVGGFVSHYIAENTESHDIGDYVQTFLREHHQEIQKFFQSQDFSDAVKAILPKVFSFVGHTASVVWSVAGSCIMLLYMFFILLDYEYLTENWVKIFPPKNRRFWLDVARDVEGALNSYIRGQSLVALVMGVLFCIGFTIIDFPMAIGLGILIGILDLVPYLHTFALVPTVFLALMKAADTGQNFWVIFGLAVLVFCVVQVIIDMVVTPKVMGHAMGLNPAVLLLSLSVWGTVFGFIGLIIALPLTTLIIAYWKRYVTNDAASANGAKGANEDKAKEANGANGAKVDEANGAKVDKAKAK